MSILANKRQNGTNQADVGRIDAQIYYGNSLFPDQHKEFELWYAGKSSEEDVLSRTPLVQLNKLETFPNSNVDSSWHNMLIYGDNLCVLKTILSNPFFYQKVQLVYIDPPFSTSQDYRVGKKRTATVSRSNRDKIAYTDQLKGKEYLEFLRRRLILLKELMSENGSIYVHIDYKVGHYVKIIMDDVFGQDNFINDITRIKCNPKNFARKGYGNIKDMILFYSKTKKYVWNGAVQDFTEQDIKRLFPKVDKIGKRYTTTPLHAPGETLNGPTGREWKNLKPPKGRHWRYSPQELTKLDQKGFIEWSTKGNPRKKIYADECAKKGKKRQDIWEFKDPPYPKYPTEKNIEMIKIIIQASSSQNAIVLDCFAGSGNTIIASEQLGRRWIAIDNSRAAIETTKKKLLESRNYTPFSVFQAKELKEEC